MRLTTKALRQLIKEELAKVLEAMIKPIDNDIYYKNKPFQVDGARGEYVINYDDTDSRGLDVFALYAGPVDKRDLYTAHPGFLGYVTIKKDRGMQPLMDQVIKLASKGR